MRLDLLLRSEMQERIINSAKTHYPLEAGGLLLGYRKKGCIEITDCTEPTGIDLQTRTKFVRQDQHHKSYAVQRWAASGGLMDWVGEWHSHPDSTPDPSGIDLKSWKKLVQRQRRPMVYFIVGSTSCYAGLMHEGRYKPNQMFETARSSNSCLLESSQP